MSAERSTTALPGPLSGVRIADFTIHAAGPFGTHLLSQLGAECIKIESRSRPDAFRKPHAVYGRMTAATFDQVSANKLSVRLNLKKPEAIELAKRLVAVSDATAESFRADVMKRLHIDFDTLKQVNPKLVMLSLSSCGQTGPDSHFAGYAPLFGAWGGLGWMSGYADGPPIEMRHVMDHATGYHAAVTLLAGLHQARRDQQPVYVDLAAREVSSAMIGDALVLASMGRTPQRPGNRHPGYAPHGIYATNQPDRWLSLAVTSEAQWQALLQVLGADAMANDGRFSTNESRLDNQDALDDMLTKSFATHDATAIMNALQAAGVPSHVSWNMEDIAADAHLRERGALTPVDDPGNPKRLAVGSPARYSRTSDVGIHRGTPALGGDEPYVLGELLGLSDAQRSDLEAREVIY